MSTVAAFVLLASIATTSQNRASFVVADIATEADCRRMLVALQEVWTYETAAGIFTPGSKRVTSVSGTCVQYSKIMGP